MSTTGTPTPLALSIDPTIPWRLRGPNFERVADCSSSLTAEALLNTYKTAHELKSQNAALVAILETHERWLVERIEWLTKEAHSGGNWDHLNTRRTEAAYALEKFRALVNTTKGETNG